MTNFKLCSYLVIIILTSFFQLAIAQPGPSSSWWDQLNDPKADFNTIVAQADSFFTNADSIEISLSPISPKHFGYWYHFWRHRLDSNGSTRIDAFDAARDISYDTNYCTTNPYIPLWSEIGPSAVSEGTNGAKGVGFVNEAWIKPSNHNVIIIGTAGGGVFKTIDGGNSWIDLMTSRRMAGVAVRALEVNPDNENHIYISIGDKGYGSGVFRTTDGGTNWYPTTLTKDPLNNYEGGIPRKIVANKPQYFGDAYAITKDVVYKTTNGFLLFPFQTDTVDTSLVGEEWINLARNQSGHVFFSTSIIGFNPNDPSTWSQIPRTIKRFEESGSSVTNLTSNLNWNHPNTIAYTKVLICTANDRPNDIYALQERIDTIGNLKRTFVSFYSSVNNGSTFNLEFETQISGQLREDFAASLYHSQTFYVSGPIVAHRITKSGSTWTYDQNWSNWTNVNATNYAHADVRDIEVLTALGGNDLVFWSTDGGLFKSVYNVFENVTEQDLCIWMVNGFVDFDGTDEIFCGVYHGGNNMRDRDGDWLIRSGGDGGCWAVNDGDKQHLIAGVNESIRRFHRNGNQAGTGPDVTEDQWWLFVAFPIETWFGTTDSFLVAGNDLLVYDWSQNQFVQNLTSSINTSLIRDVKCHGGNNQILVFANNRNCSADSALFKSTNGGQNWTDISTNLNADAPINTIFMHPNDPNEIWVGIDGFITGQKVFVTYNNGTTWTNVSDDLGPYPVNDFAFDAIANILYAATDFGVYYLDKSISNDSWHCYFKNLPTAYVNQIDVNYCTKKLVAATAGRGFHHVDLWQLNEHTNPTVTWSDTTLVTGKEFYSPGSINISGTVTINGSLYMHEDAYINVPPGSKLIVDGGLISNSCGGLWGGIRAWGANHQNEPNQRPFSQSDLTKHGKIIVKNDAILENAHTAVQLGRDDLNFNKGGIVSASNSTFRNNYRSIRFLSYHNHVPITPFTEVNNTSSILNCSFLSEGKLDDSQLIEPNAQIHMHDVKGLAIRGCSFADSTEWNSSYRLNIGRFGIKSYDATFSVDPVCSSQQMFYATNACWNQSGADSNTFYGYQQGISVENWNSISPVTVRGAKFENNRHPFVLWGGDLVEIYKNDFIHTPPVTSAALNLIGSTGYFVEENNFSSSGSNYGIIVGNSGGEANEVKNNYFESLGTATQYQGPNDGALLNDGVQHLCNEMVATTRDVSVSGGDIALYQGFCAQGTANANSSPANNSFSSSCTNVSHYDVYKPSSQWIYYAHLTGEQPVCYSNKVILNHCYDEMENPEAGERCPISTKSNPSGHLGGINDLESLIADFYLTVDSLSHILKTSILNDDPASDVTDTILDASPLLKDEILVLAISGKPTPLPDSNLLEILYSVAPLSEEVLTYLEARSHALVEAVDLYVAQNELVLSPTIREYLGIWQLEREVKYAQEEVLRYYLVYDSTGNGFDTALAYLQGQDGEFYMKKEFQLLLRMNELTGAGALLSDIDRDYNSDNHLDGFVEWGDIALELAADSAGPFLLLTDSTLEQRVRILADTTKIEIVNYDARALLSLVFDEPQKVLPPIEIEGGPMDKRGVNSQFFDDFEETNADMLLIYPNPARDAVTIEFELPEKIEKGKITVYTVGGRQVLSQNVTASKRQVNMDISELKGGVYLYLLTADGEFVARRRLIVSK